MVSVRCKQLRIPFHFVTSWDVLFGSLTPWVVVFFMIIIPAKHKSLCHGWKIPKQNHTFTSLTCWDEILGNELSEGKERSWLRQAGSLQRSSEIFRKYYNKPVIQGNKLDSAILASENFVMFLIYRECILLVLLLLDNVLQTWLSLLMLNFLLFVWISCLLFKCMSYGCINALKSHGISAFWSCDRIGKLNETYLKLKFDWDSITWHQKTKDHMPSTMTPTLS